MDSPESVLTSALHQLIASACNWVKPYFLMQSLALTSCVMCPFTVASIMSATSKGKSGMAWMMHAFMEDKADTKFLSNKCRGLPEARILSSDCKNRDIFVVDNRPAARYLTLNLKKKRPVGSQRELSIIISSCNYLNQYLVINACRNLSFFKDNFVSEAKYF